MSSIIGEIPLGFDGLRYIREELELGRKLARTLAQVPLKTGRVVTYFPPDVPEVAVHRFGRDGSLSNISREACLAHAEFIRNFIFAFLSPEGHQVGLALFEHPYAKKMDPAIQRLKVPHCYLEEDVVFFAASPTSLQEVGRLMRLSGGYPHIGALVRLLSDSDIPQDRAELSESTLRVYAQNCKHLVIGAYDDEGFLVWSRT